MDAGRLQVGDKISVNNALTGERVYPVRSVDGNRAITDFRTFNRKVYLGGRVYEYGKKLSPIYNNTYILIRSE